MKDYKQIEDFIAGWNGHVESTNDETENVLSLADPMLGEVITKVIAEVGRKRLKPSNASSHFDSIVRSITYQQLSKKAAANIYARYTAVLGGISSPEKLIRVSSEELRQVGLSKQKIKYLKTLALVVTNGELDLNTIDRLPDCDIIEQLTKFPGIGLWTSQMFLMFRLLRPDVLPVKDVGIQRGLQIAHELKHPASPDYVESAGRKWIPYRSIACLYLWAAVDLGIRTTS